MTNDVKAGKIKVETIDSVGLLIFCGTSPQNAMTTAMQHELADAVRRLDDDSHVRVLVLTGSGHTAFATDADDAESGEAAAFTALRGCRMPLIARLRGECIGIGLALALCADIRIAAADTGFRLSAARAAALGAERLLAEIVGLAQARYLLLTGERIEAAEALRIGLVTRLVPDSDLSDTVADLARQLAEADPELLQAAKRSLSCSR